MLLAGIRSSSLRRSTIGNRAATRHFRNQAKWRSESRRLEFRSASSRGILSRFCRSQVQTGRTSVSASLRIVVSAESRDPQRYARLIHLPLHRIALIQSCTGNAANAWTAAQQKHRACRTHEVVREDSSPVMWPDKRAIRRCARGRCARVRFEGSFAAVLSSCRLSSPTPVSQRQTPALK